MKIIIHITLVSILLFSFTGFITAQSTATASVEIDARLVEGLSMNFVQGDLDFGDIIQSENTSIVRDPGSGVLIQVTGQPNRDVTFNFNNTQLSNSEWANGVDGVTDALTFNPQIKHTMAAKSYTDSNPVTSGNAYSLSNVNGNGILYLWVGGQLNVDNSKPQGDYKGTFTITVSY